MKTTKNIINEASKELEYTEKYSRETLREDTPEKPSDAGNKPKCFPEETPDARNTPKCHPEGPSDTGNTSGGASRHRKDA